MRWRIGKPRSVVAEVQNLLDAYPIDDNSAALIEFESGALSSLDTSWAHRAGPNPYEFYGTEGYMGYNTWPGGGLFVNSTRVQAERIQGTIGPTPMPAAVPGPLDQWIGATLHRTEMTITVEDGPNLTELLDGIYTSAREGREIRFADPVGDAN